MKPQSCDTCLFGRTGVATGESLKSGELLCHVNPPTAQAILTPGPAGTVQMSIISMRPRTQDSAVCARWWDSKVGDGLFVAS